MEFIIANYVLFLVIAGVLLLGLFGYFMDRKKYEDYRKEILNENRAINTLNSEATINNVAEKINVEESNEVIPSPLDSIESMPLPGEEQK